MRLLVAVCVLVLCALHSTVAESYLHVIPETPEVGVCSVPYVKKSVRYVMDRTKPAWVMEWYNETKQREECCDGYQPEKLKPLACSPICDPPCENSDCMAPDTCVCHPRHVMINNSSNSCYEVCDSCVNGECLSPDDLECSCFHGYQRDVRFPHICDPVCSPACINSSCAFPSFCKCYDGYKPHSDDSIDHICVPHCEESCVFGTCTEPNVCTCYEGYINDKDSPSICLPVCNRTCENGYCYSPDMCSCRDGFTLHPRNPYLCIPEIPEEVLSRDNTCKLRISSAVKYDSDCFVIKENITVSVPSDCSYIRPGSSCSQSDSCHSSECDINFRCSLVKLNRSNEIHCFVEDEEFETDIVDVDHVINAAEWIDVKLEIYSFQKFNSTIGINGNSNRKWTFLTTNKTPVCGKNQFGVKVRECEMSMTSSPKSSHVNSTFMFWMNVFLVVVFLLMVGVGVGGFLWARHRRLNNPLNYRDDMTQGYYNEGFENRCAELISDDDESDHFPL